MQPFIQCAGVCESNSMGASYHHEDDVVKFDSQTPSMSSLENAYQVVSSYWFLRSTCRILSWRENSFVHAKKSCRCASGGGEDEGEGKGEGEGEGKGNGEGNCEGNGEGNGKGNSEGEGNS